MCLLDNIENGWHPGWRRYAAWCRSEPALAGTTPDTLRAQLLDCSGTVDYDSRDDVLAALVRLARTDKQAGLVLIHCLLPGLRAVVRRHGRDLEPGDATADAVSALWSRIVKYPLTRRPRKIAMNLLLDAGHDLVTARRRWQRQVSRSTVDCRELEPPVQDDTWTSELIWHASTAAGVLTPREVTLIDATRLRGLPLRDAAFLLGISHEAAKKARRRGEYKLAAYWTDQET